MELDELTRFFDQRMRRSSVLIINLRGIATEACKNIVLAGVGSITILDPDKVLPEDLGAGFFFREEDIGQRVSTHYLFILFAFG
jgi:ubiquitin-like 1-activating enzyme E1 A